MDGQSGMDGLGMIWIDDSEWISIDDLGWIWMDGLGWSWMELDVWFGMELVGWFGMELKMVWDGFFMFFFGTLQVLESPHINFSSQGYIIAIYKGLTTQSQYSS